MDSIEQLTRSLDRLENFKDCIYEQNADAPSRISLLSGAMNNRRSNPIRIV